MKKLVKFNPHYLTSTEIVDWIRAGDIEEAKELATHVAYFLSSLAENESAKQALIGAGVFWIGTDSAKLIAEKLLAKASSVKGKSTKSGAELFAKVLVPNKPTKRQFEARWIAAVADLNLNGASKNEFESVAAFINGVIDKNNKILGDFKSGARKDLEDYSPGIPKRKISRDQLEKSYRKFKPEIDKINGIKKHILK